MRSNGMISRFHHGLMGNRESVENSFGSLSNIETIPLKNLVKIYQSLLFIYGFSLLILLAENLHYSCMKKKNENNRTISLNS